jgi:sterol desaturase/sphingolipid hydroxylase (fatty acid hydroxylase superfamily)
MKSTGYKDKELSIEEVLDYEKKRYVKKGYGIVFAILFTLSWFFGVPQIAKFIWPTKIENEGSFVFFSSYILHEFVFILNNFVMWAIYKLEWSFFERYKIHDKPWPWKEDPEKWNKLILETITLLFVNQVIILPLLLIPHYITNQSPYRCDLDSLPSVFEVIWQTVFFMLVDDFSFYWSHRFLHWDKIYPYIHKIHHKHINSVSVASEYAHPIEFIFGNLLTSNLGPIILGRKTHLFTYLMWVVLRISETTDGHCGYEFSWSPYRLLPMSGSSEFHNYHHLSFKGNYSSFFTYLDRVFGTVNVKYHEFVEKKKEYERKIKEAKEKVEKKELKDDRNGSNSPINDKKEN